MPPLTLAGQTAYFRTKVLFLSTPPPRSFRDASASKKKHPFSKSQSASHLYHLMPIVELNAENATLSLTRTVLASTTTLGLDGNSSAGVDLSCMIVTLALIAMEDARPVDKAIPASHLSPHFLCVETWTACTSRPRPTAYTCVRHPSLLSVRPQIQLAVWDQMLIKGEFAG